jgi:phosphoribosylformylglycinamidine synthase
LIQARQINACHDISDGGLITALAEMAMAGNLGARIDLEGVTPHVALFSEDQARYVLCSPTAEIANIFENTRLAGVPARHVGTVGGDRLIVGDLTSISVEELRTAHEGWFPAYMKA